MKGCKNLYEAWKQKKLPEKLQQKLDECVNHCESWDEGLFKAGFLLSKNYEEYRNQLQEDF